MNIIDKSDFPMVREYLILINDVLEEDEKKREENTEERKLNYGKSIIKIIADGQNMSEKTCENNLLLEIEELMNINKSIWQDWIDGVYYIGKEYNAEEKSLESKIKTCFVSPKENINIFNEEIPEDLQELIDAEKNINEKIKNLKEIKDKSYQVKKKIKDLSRIKISLCENISDLKHHYNIEVLKTNKKGKKEVISFNDNYLYDYEDNSEFLDESLLFVINSKAKQMLTDRQLVIFNLYYKCGLTQREIAGIIGDDQRNITNDLKQILKKIRKIV